MDNLISILSQGNLSAAFVGWVDTRISELDEELKKLTEEQACLQKDINPMNDREIQLGMIAGALSSLKENTNDLTITEKRVLIKLLVKKIVWDGQDLHIFMDGD